MGRLRPGRMGESRQHGVYHVCDQCGKHFRLPGWQSQLGKKCECGGTFRGRRWQDKQIAEIIAGYAKGEKPDAA